MTVSQLDKTFSTVEGLDDQVSYAKGQKPVTLNLDLLLQEDTKYEQLDVDTFDLADETKRTLRLDRFLWTKLK